LRGPWAGTHRDTSAESFRSRIECAMRCELPIAVEQPVTHSTCGDPPAKGEGVFRNGSTAGSASPRADASDAGRATRHDIDSVIVLGFDPPRMGHSTASMVEEQKI